MKIIKDFLLGECDIATFMQTYMSDNELYEYIQRLIPKDAISDSSHEYWRKCIIRSGLECYNFDVRDMLYSHCGLGESEKDQLEIFNTIRALYLWAYPRQKCTKLYEDRINFYLELEQDCYGGPEVVHLVKSVAEFFFSIKPKSVRKKVAREHLEKIFHISGKKKPHWIHGPQWPMGNCSPMEFVEQKKDGNTVYYEFRDVDSGRIRVVRQFL